MKLLGFKYLRRQHILALILIVIISSMLFSLTALSLLGFYRSFTAYLGEGEDIVVLYDRKSRTPFTGLVPAYLSERIGALDGVLAGSPETIVPCIIEDETVFLRGIVPEEFIKLNPLTIMDGCMLELDDLNSMVLGKNVAERLHLKPGDRVLVLGVLADQYIELHVKGIFISNSPMDDEVLAPLCVGQWLRGTDYGHVTIIRFKIDRSQVSFAKIFEEIAKESQEPSSVSQTKPEQPPNIIPKVVSRFRVEDLGVKEVQRFMESYVERYGISREALLILSAIIFFLSSASIVMASKNLIRQHSGEVQVLRSIGASQKALKMDLLAKLLLWSLASSAAGLFLAAAILWLAGGVGCLQILSHNIVFQLDPLTLALNFILVSTLIIISVLGSELK